jgi:hypothetical protein
MPALLTLADIEAARERIAGGIYVSPCVESIPLSQLTGRISSASWITCSAPAASRSAARAARCC